MARDVIPALEVKELIISDTGSLTRTSQVFKYPARLGNPGATATVGFVKTGVDTNIVTLAQNATADTWVVHLPAFHQNDIITAIGICGQIESGGNAVTIDYELKEATAVATGTTFASIQAGTQVAKSADYLVDETTALATPHTCTGGELLFMLVTVTTAATTDVELLHVSLTITKK